jgi:hypothetical protein
MAMSANFFKWQTIGFLILKAWGINFLKASKCVIVLKLLWQSHLAMIVWCLQKNLVTKFFWGGFTYNEQGLQVEISQVEKFPSHAH